MRSIGAEMACRDGTDGGTQGSGQHWTYGLRVRSVAMHRLQRIEAQSRLFSEPSFGAAKSIEESTWFERPRQWHTSQFSECRLYARERTAATLKLEWLFWVGCRQPTTRTQWPLKAWSGQSGQQAPNPPPTTGLVCKPPFWSSRSAADPDLHLPDDVLNGDGSLLMIKLPLTRIWRRPAHRP